MKKTTAIFVIIISSAIVFGQDVVVSPITVKKTVFSTSYYQNGEKLTMKELHSILESAGGDVSSELASAKQKYSLGMILSHTGGFLIGYPIGQAAASGKELDMTMLLSGTCLTGVGVLFDTQSRIIYQEAIQKYNAQ